MNTLLKLMLKLPRLSYLNIIYMEFDVFDFVIQLNQFTLLISF